ncbi:MAG: aminopeptidase P family N-terminal domain-containing protein, partial [Pirellulaceae bacterium]
MANLDVDVDACRARQRRLLDVMHRQQLDLVIVTQTEHVQYLAGPRFAWLFQPVAALAADGHLALVAPNREPERCAADTVATYQAQKHSTLRNDQRQASAEVLAGALAGRKYRRIGVEFSSFGPHLGLAFGAAQHVDVEPDLYRLRRRKDADELARIERAIAATARMYARAREILRPGLEELHMFSELQAVAVQELGEMLTGTGNDYQCGSRGGPPRAQRSAAAGEL